MQRDRLRAVSSLHDALDLSRPIVQIFCPWRRNASIWTVPEKSFMAIKELF
jgi:hypothetical protein